MPKEHCRCPKGEVGMKVIEEMNRHHEPLMRWAMPFLPDSPSSDVLDVGCGGGVMLEKLAVRYPDAKLTGVDISMTSVKASSERNSKLMEAGRLRVDVGSVSDLPYEKESFDIMTAVETYYFWPDLEMDIKSAATRLRCGGTMMIVAETYERPDLAEQNARYARDFGVKIVSNETMVSFMEKAGMDAGFRVSEKEGWVAFTGKKR